MRFASVLCLNAKGERVVRRMRWGFVPFDAPDQMQYGTKFIHARAETIDTKGLALTDAVKKILGKPGTPIKLLIEREGEEKPLKYPGIFFKSELMLLTKIDLLPYVPFSIDVAEANARTIHPDIQIARLSCTTREGLDAWLRWIDARALSGTKAEPQAPQLVR